MEGNERRKYKTHEYNEGIRRVSWRKYKRRRECLNISTYKYSIVFHSFLSQ